MRITSTLLACAQSMLLAACAVTQPAGPQPDRSPASAPVATPAPAATAYRPGIGVVESASVVSLPSSGSAAGGGTAGAPAGPTMAYRLRMPDGTTQNVVQAGERYALGDRVELTGDGRLIRR